MNSEEGHLRLSSDLQLHLYKHTHTHMHLCTYTQTHTVLGRFFFCQHNKLDLSGKNNFNWGSDSITLACRQVRLALGQFFFVFDDWCERNKYIMDSTTHGQVLLYFIRKHIEETMLYKPSKQHCSLAFASLLACSFLPWVPALTLLILWCVTREL